MMIMAEFFGCIPLAVHLSHKMCSNQQHRIFAAVTCQIGAIVHSGQDYGLIGTGTFNASGVHH